MSRYAIVLFVLVLFGSGCAGQNDAVQPPERLLRLDFVTLSMPTGVNSNWPAAVELVRVPDEKLAESLLAIEPQVWFAAEGEKFRQAHPEAHFDSWEVVPGTTVGPVDVWIDDDVAGVLFCGLKSGEVAPVRVERDGEVTVQIDDSGCVLSGGEPSQEASNVSEMFKSVTGLAGDVMKALGL